MGGGGGFSRRLAEKVPTDHSDFLAAYLPKAAASDRWGGFQRCFRRISMGLCQYQTRRPEGSGLGGCGGEVNYVSKSRLAVPADRKTQTSYIYL